MSTDPRLARRRQEVREEGARLRLRRVLGILALIGLAAAAAWVVQSPWLAVRNIEVSGARRVEVLAVLAASGVREGTPLLTVRPSRLEAALESDPWVGRAEIKVVLPDSVEVMLRERSPLAGVPVGAAWAVVAGDGTVLELRKEVRLPVVLAEVGRPHPGDRLPSAARAVLPFLAGLPVDLASEAQVEVDGEAGEVWAEVAGYRVRLGRAVEMADKATALVAVLADGVPPGATVDLLAASRPAVRQAGP